MSDWGIRTYGEPCRECGFSWHATLPDARALVEAMPSRLAGVLADATGEERHPALTWTVCAYVLHVGDNLRIWAERLAGITLGGSPVVNSYDENALAEARGYDRISLAAARWSLGGAIRDWGEAIGSAPEGLAMVHPERGVIGLDDVVGSTAHDAVHHEWDIRRSLDASRGGS